MNRIPGIIFHTLKGSPGWSYCRLSKLDIARVLKIQHRERLFRIFDRDKPYSLEIQYYLPKTETSVAPTFGGRYVGWTVYNETTLEHTITKRYAEEAMVKKEISDIEKKMKKLDEVARKLTRQFRDDL